MTNKLEQIKTSEWWSPNGGFFGVDYRRGDDSVCGYLPSQALSLEERTKREARGVMHFLNLNPGASILDAPCGYGRHSLALAAMGFRMIGVDINPEFLTTAQKKSSQDLTVDFRKGDIRYLECIKDSSVDAVINMFLSFGFFEKESDNLLVLESFKRVLQPHGKLLIHTDLTTEILDNGSYRMSEERTLNSGGTLRIEEIFESESRQLCGTWTIENEAHITTLTPYRVRIYSTDEYTAILKLAGFANIQFFGSFEAVPFQASSEELIIVATK